MTLRWLLPLVIVAAFLVGAAGALAIENGVFQSAAPTPTVLPTTTAKPRPTAAITVVQITETPSAAPTRAAPTHVAPTHVAPTRVAATAAPTSFDPTAADLATIRAHGYTPHGHGASTPDGFGGTLYAWSGVCSGSADGYCQKVFFFIGTRYLGTDTARSSILTAVRAAGPQNIDVTYPNYAPQDPLCCPSGTPVTITYHWNGTRLIPSGTPPGH